MVHLNIFILEKVKASWRSFQHNFMSKKLGVLSMMWSDDGYQILCASARRSAAVTDSSVLLARVIIRVKYVATSCGVHMVFMCMEEKGGISLVWRCQQCNQTGKVCRSHVERSWLKRDGFGVKKGPKDVPKCAQMKKAIKAKSKTCIKAKKTRELKERCNATPVCIGNVYFGHNSLIWWLIR